MVSTLDLTANIRAVDRPSRYTSFARPTEVLRSLRCRVAQIGDFLFRRAYNFGDGFLCVFQFVFRALREAAGRLLRFCLIVRLGIRTGRNPRPNRGASLCMESLQ